MQVELVDYTQDAERKIGLYASICYDSKTDEESCLRRAKHVANNGHLACLRFATATFRISGISRICSHQFVRSKHLDFLQRSQRYVEEDNTGFISPDSFGSYTTDVRDIYNDLLYYYNDMIKQGIKKEDARFILPQAIETELYVTGNFQAWQDFINLRKYKAAQWEIQEVATRIERQLNNIAPNIFNLEYWEN